MTLADLHNHSLWGVDDGPKSREAAMEMIGASYRDGVRWLCLTPHCHPGYFGDNFHRAAEAFESLREAAAQRYPDLQLILGNELRYARGCSNWLQEGHCRTIGGSDHVLVDFVASDAHDLKDRPPQLSDAYRYILRKHGASCADAVCCGNARRLFFRAADE